MLEYINKCLKRTRKKNKCEKCMKTCNSKCLKTIQKYKAADESFSVKMCCYKTHKMMAKRNRIECSTKSYTKPNSVESDKRRLTCVQLVWWQFIGRASDNEWHSAARLNFKFFCTVEKFLVKKSYISCHILDTVSLSWIKNFNEFSFQRSVKFILSKNVK